MDLYSGSGFDASAAADTVVQAEDRVAHEVEHHGDKVPLRGRASMVGVTTPEKVTLVQWVGLPTPPVHFLTLRDLSQV